MSSVNVYNARVMYTRPRASSPGSEVKREGPTFEESPEAQREPCAQVFLMDWEAGRGFLVERELAMDPLN